MRKIETERFLEVESIIGDELYQYYRENRQYVAKGINQRMLFDKAVNGLLITLSNIIQGTEGGIHIKDLGYFCNVKNNKKMQIVKKSLLSTTEYREIYSNWFFPESPYDEWYLYTKDISKALKRVVRYKLHFGLIKSKYEMMAFGTSLYKVGKDIKY